MSWTVLLCCRKFSISVFSSLVNPVDEPGTGDASRAYTWEVLTGAAASSVESAGSKMQAEITEMKASRVLSFDVIVSPY